LSVDKVWGSVTGVAIGWAGQSEGRIELCVIAAATLCHEMVQFVMYLALLTLAFNGERLLLESDSFYYPRKTREWSSRGVSLVTAASSRDSYTPDASRFDAPPGCVAARRPRQTQPPMATCCQWPRRDVAPEIDPRRSPQWEVSPVT